ncbi:unnamed protein product [Fusarium venenatum]|uniref:Uncharacterized protein n=1 Tax=Fusarium venenatum TaxID=56646 RepID=A0A2L2U1T1_9HYPO|nr:uncharacterized protein FVRRES_08222 [Fusarium venenatum]CEI68145.1 unnamed protein product [Fusarium venenatum]
MVLFNNRWPDFIYKWQQSEARRGLKCTKTGTSSAQEGESHFTGGEACDNSDHRGRATFTEFWKLKSLGFYKSQVPDVFDSSTIDKSEVGRPTEEFMGVVAEAQTKTNMFRASLVFGGEDLAEPEKRKEFLRQHLVVMSWGTWSDHKFNITIAISTDYDPKLHLIMNVLQELQPSVKVRIILLRFGESQEAISGVSEDIIPSVHQLRGIQAALTKGCRQPCGHRDP